MEDAAELEPQHPHLVKLVARCANVEGVGEITVRDLVRQALRMRPDRIVVGEVRGAEVVDLLAALNTGHDGGAGTVHANNPAEVPARLEALAALGGLDRFALHSQLAAAVQVLLHVGRDRNGKRRLERDRGVAAGWQRLGRGGDRLARRQRIRKRRGGSEEPAARPGSAVTAAALALALALVVAPPPSRCRLERVSATRRRFPVMVVAVALAVAVAMTLPVTAALAAAILVGTLLLRRRRSIARRARAVEASALQGALDVLVGELRVGAHPVAAFDVAAREVDGPVAASLRAVAARARLGADVAGGLRSFAAASRLPAHWERLALFWRLAQTHGLAIATLMRAAHRDIVERERFSARVDAGMAGARATAAVLAGLPVLGVCLGQLIGADPLGFLLSGGAGGWLLVVGVTLACCGLLWSDRHHGAGR